MLYSTRFPLPRPEADDTPVDLVDLFADRDAFLGEAVLYRGAGTLASRPLSSGGTPGIAGSFYIVTDQPGGQQVHFDYGTGWLVLPNVSNAWTPLVPAAGLVVWIGGNFSFAARRFGDMLQIRGGVSASVRLPDGPVHIITLPAGMRPAAKVFGVCTYTSASMTPQATPFSIGTDGTMLLPQITLPPLSFTVSLDGVLVPLL